MKNEPLISVIVPVYNTEKYVGKCIESILNQTYRNIELVLVNDGSKDESLEICQQYESQDGRVVVIDKKNGGLSAARNTGACAAKGDWIMFVDGDDWIELGMCEAMIAKTIADGALELVMCEWVKDYNGNLYHNQCKFTDGQVFEGGRCRELQGLMLNFDYYIACAYCKLIKRSFIEKNNIYHDEDLRQGVEGVYFNLKLFDKLQKAVFVKQCFYHYIYNDESISVKMSEKTIKMLTFGFARIDEFIQGKGNAAFLEQNLSIRVLSGIITSTLRGYFGATNDYKYSERKQKMKVMLDAPIFRKYLKKYRFKNNLTLPKKVVLAIINMRLYGILIIVAKLRHWQLSLKSV
jgi:Glycosyltransferases involved in cell wall biogenesis